MQNTPSKINDVLLNSLDEKEKIHYQKGISLRIIDSLFNSAAVIFAFYCLIWAANGGDTTLILTILIGVTIVTIIARYFFSAASMRLLYRITFNGSLRLRTNVLKHLTRLPLGAFRNLHSGKVSQTLSEDMMWMENNESFFKPNMQAEIIMILVLLLAVAVLSWPVALATVVVWGVGLFFVDKLKKSLEIGMRYRSDGLSESARHMMEFVDGMQVIRSFGNTQAAERDFQK